MSTQARTKNSTKRVGLYQCMHHYLIKCNLFLPWCSWDIAHFTLHKTATLFKTYVFVVSLLIFGDSLTSNILFEVTLGKLSYIYDRPFLYNTVKHIDQWDNNSWCVLGFNT